MSTAGRDFGRPTMTEHERQEAIRRAQKKRLFRTRHLANSVPPHVLAFLLRNEEAVLARSSKPVVPDDVLHWLAQHAPNFAGGQGVVSETVEEVLPPTPKDYPLQQATCAVCGASFEARRSDAQFCSGKCRVAAHRARAA
jgi:hypothetical protein